MGEDDDLWLLDRWCAGDGVAGNALFQRHFASVYRFFENKVDGEVDDLVQETLLACLRGRETFRRQSSFRTYLFAIARHTLYHYWRRKACARPALDFDEISVAALSSSIRTRIARKEDRARLLDALRELPIDQQMLLELHYWEELERDQLAEVFGVAEATTRSRLFRARQALRERLGLPASTPVPTPSGGQDFDAWARALRPEVDGPGSASELRNGELGEGTTDA